MDTATLLPKETLNLKVFLENAVKDYRETNRYLKEIFKNSKQYHGRTQYSIEADFDEGIITAKAELFLNAEANFKRLNRRFFSKLFYKENEKEEIFRKAIEGRVSKPFFLTIFSKWEGYNEVSFGVVKKEIYQKSDFSEKLMKGWDEIVEKLKKIADISKKLDVCAEIINAVQIINPYHFNEDKNEERKDRLENLQKLSPKAFENAKAIISEVERLQKGYKGLDNLTLDEDIMKLLNDIIIFLAPGLEKTSINGYVYFPRRYYKVPGGEDLNGKNSSLSTSWTSSYLTYE